MMQFLNLGCGNVPSSGFVNIDRFAPEAELLSDAKYLPFKENSFDIVHASHVLEHMRYLPETLEEIHRVLIPNGYLVARVPYGIETLYNPFHYCAFNEKSIHTLIESSTDAQQNRIKWNLIKMYRDRFPTRFDLIFILETVK